jgi:general secretion pathway protein G
MSGGPVSRIQPIRAGCLHNCEMSRATGITAIQGMTLLELAIAMAIVSLLAAIAIPSYFNAMERIRITQARTDMMKIYMEVVKNRRDDGHLPDTLAGISNLPQADPWGRPYVYNNFSSPGFDKKSVRKDHNLHPLNTEFDLFSIGKDGKSKPPLTAAPSRDDIVVARDGSFIGLATDF